MAFPHSKSGRTFASLGSALGPHTRTHMHGRAQIHASDVRVLAYKTTYTQTQRVRARIGQAYHAYVNICMHTPALPLAFDLSLHWFVPVAACALDLSQHARLTGARMRARAHTYSQFGRFSVPDSGRRLCGSTIGHSTWIVSGLVLFLRTGRGMLLIWIFSAPFVYALS